MGGGLIVPFFSETSITPIGQGRKKIDDLYQWGLSIGLMYLHIST